MKVRARLLLLGAAVPALALVALAVAAGLLLERRLAEEIDEHLLAQAAVESVGLFDGEDGQPHLHATRTPLAIDLQGIIPAAAIYEESGALRVQSGGGAPVPALLRHAGALGSVTLRDAGPPPRRELISAVQSPAGARYTLYLAAPLERVDAAMRRYWMAAGAAVAAVGALLLGVQLVLAARLARRIGALHAYLPRLREGQSEPAPPPDGSGDELAALRDGLYEAARQLERSRAERERGLADAAHDLRTPLGVIRTTIDLALRRPRSEAELRSALGEVKAECLRLGALTDEILAQRRGARQREPVDLAAVVGAAARGIEPLADEAGVELRVQLPRPRRAATGAAVGAAAAAAARDSAPASARDSAPASARDSAPASARISAPTSASVSRGGPLEAPVAPLLGDAGALRRLVDNLLHNAITYSPRRGRVDVELSDGGAELRLEVRDQGPGFSEEQLERVFLPFVRGDDSRGAGLGLAIVRQVATEHGGAAWAEPGPGGRVVVTLPAARRRGEDAAEPAADADAADADAADAAAAS